MDLVQLIPSLKRLDCLSDAGCVYTTYNANVFFFCATTVLAVIMLIKKSFFCRINIQSFETTTKKR